VLEPVRTDEEEIAERSDFELDDGVEVDVREEA